MKAWVPIEGYEELYSINKDGEVLTIKSGLLKSQSGGPGTNSRYRYVTLYKDNVGIKYTVHRLIGRHFIKNPHNYPYVLHIDDDREHNTVKNLKWGTQAHNHADCVRNGHVRLNPARGTAQPHAKLNPEKVREIRAIRDSGVWISQEALAAKFGISRGTLRSVLKNKHWTHVS